MKHHSNILVYLPDLRHLSDIVEGVIEFSLAHGSWNVVPVTVRLDTDSGRGGNSWIPNYQWAGVITSEPESPAVAYLGQLGVPIVGVEHETDSKLPLVRGDDYRIGQIAFEHLRNLGHKRFAFWGEGERKESTRIRRRGFEESVKNAGFDFLPSVVVLEQLYAPGIPNYPDETMQR